MRMRIPVQLAAYVMIALLFTVGQAKAADTREAWLTAKAKVALMSTEGIRTTHLNVDTVKGVVMLHGHLPGTVVDRAEPAAAYSVLAHEAMVWDAVIKPLLLRRFPRITESELKKARAFAYGSVIQDLGYYPFGNSTGFSTRAPARTPSSETTARGSSEPGCNSPR